ncbi:MAG: hypothetical protein ACRD9S_26020 [Pyrinomonadaceae bacterium]
MVTTQGQSVHLRGEEWISVDVPAACANRPRDIPGGNDSFEVKLHPEQEELKKLMPALARAMVGSAGRQAAVWIVTDNADYGDLGSLLQSYGAIGGSRVINEYEAALAMKICDEAGITITNKAIWRDRDKIIRGLQDENLKKWIQQRSQGIGRAS